MAWAGTTDDCVLAGLLMLGGMSGIAGGMVLILLPGVFRRFVTPFLPAAEEEPLPGWRVLGIAVTSGGFLLGYLGVLAL